MTAVVNALQDVADRCQVHTTPTIQVWRDSMMVEALENPSADECEDLLEKFGSKW